MRTLLTGVLLCAACASQTSTPGNIPPVDAGVAVLGIEILNRAPVFTAGTVDLRYRVSGAPARLSLWIDDQRVRDLDGSGAVAVPTNGLAEGTHLLGVSADAGTVHVSAAIPVMVDRTPPYPDWRVPDEVARDARNSSPALLHFSEPVVLDAGTSSGLPEVIVEGTAPLVFRDVAVSVDADGRTLQLTPDGGWVGQFPFEARTLMVTWKGITDLVGNPLTNFAWEFRVSPWLPQGRAAPGVRNASTALAVWDGGIAVALPSLALAPQVLALSGGAWVPLADASAVAPGATGYDPSVVLASNGGELFAAGQAADGVRVARLSGGAFRQLGPVLPGGYGLPTLGFAPDRTLSVAYRPAWAGVQVEALDGGTWTAVGPAVSALTESQVPISYLVDSQGVRWLAVPDWVNGALGLVVYRFDGVAWAAVGDVVRDAAFFESPGFLVDASGAPWLAYRIGSPVAVRVLRWSHGVWVRAGQDIVPAAGHGNVSSRPVLGPLAERGPLVAFTTTSSPVQRLEVCLWSGTAWECDDEIDDSSLEGGGGASIADGPGGPFLGVWENRWDGVNGVVVRAPNR